MSFSRNASGLLLTSVAESVLGLAASVVLARWLTVEDRGLFAVATTLGATIVALARLGLPSSAVFRIRSIGAPPASVATTTFALGIGLALVLMVACAAFEPWISRRLLDSAPAVVLYLGIATVLPPMLLQLGAGLARGMDRFALSNAHTLATNLAGLLAVIGALTLRPGDLVTALLAFAASRMLLASLFVVAVLRVTGWSRTLDRGELAGGLRFALKSYLQSLAGQIHERVDILLLALLLEDAQAVALYTIAVGVVDRLKVIPEAISTALFPRISGVPPAEAARFTSSVARHALVSVGLVLVGLALVAPWLLPLLYGEAYAASVAPFLILLPAMAFHSLYHVVARYFMAVDRQQINIVAQALSLVANIGLNLLLIPRLGIVGAALASLASYTLETVLITSVFLRESGLRADQMLRPRAGDLAAYRSLGARLRSREAR